MNAVTQPQFRRIMFKLHDAERAADANVHLGRAKRAETGDGKVLLGPTQS